MYGIGASDSGTNPWARWKQHCWINAADVECWYETLNENVYLNRSDRRARTCNILVANNSHRYSADTMKDERPNEMDSEAAVAAKTPSDTYASDNISLNEVKIREL